MGNNQEKGATGGRKAKGKDKTMALPNYSNEELPQSMSELNSEKSFEMSKENSQIKRKADREASISIMASPQKLEKKGSTIEGKTLGRESSVKIKSTIPSLKTKSFSLMLVS